jgi:glycosyltransferase involved in cell wall biosynthesis
MKTVLFFDPNLNERGTSIAVYDYADYNEKILGNKSIIISLKTSELKSLDKFKTRFTTHIVDIINDVYKIKGDYFHVLKYGYNDGILHPESKNLIHAVFPSYDPHGDVYAYISQWLANFCNKDTPFVPHMVNLPEYLGNYKNEFNTKDKLVIGYYGGNNFEIQFARQAVIDVANKRKDIIFLFMNQNPFCNLENIIFIEGTIDQEQKVAFINTCDAMIHARERGETFGLAIAEFSTKNKPIITYSNSPECNHIEILKDKGIYYHDYNSLCNTLMNIQKSDIEGKEWNCYQEYTPEKVIAQFNKIFLK